MVYVKLSRLLIHDPQLKIPVVLIPVVDDIFSDVGPNLTGQLFFSHMISLRQLKSGNKRKVGEPRQKPQPVSYTHLDVYKRQT